MKRGCNGHSPQVAAGAFVADSAEMIGDVSVGAGSSIWYQTVLRADLDKIVIGQNSNVQDGSVLHVDAGKPVVIGDYVTIGHRAVVHGCQIKDRVLIGMNATILNGAVIGEGAVVAAGAVVKENTVVPPDTLMAGVPAKIMKTMDEADRALRQQHAEEYVRLWRELYHEQSVKENW